MKPKFDNLAMASSSGCTGIPRRATIWSREGPFLRSRSMGVWRGFLVAICLCSCGCIPREGESIGAVDPLDSIPAIQKAADARDKKAVPALIDQLSNDDPAIRFYAIEALQRITGQTFDYVYYDEVDQRKPALERWRRWLKQRKT